MPVFFQPLPEPHNYFFLAISMYQTCDSVNNALYVKAILEQREQTSHFENFPLCVNDDKMMNDWCCGSFSGGIDQFQLGMFPGLDS